MSRARVTTGAKAVQQSISQSINQSINQLIDRWIKQSINQHISPVTFQVYPINQSTDYPFKMNFLFGFETFPGFYGFLLVSGYISEVRLGGMIEGVVGVRELSVWPRVLM